MNFGARGGVALLTHRTRADAERGSWHKIGEMDGAVTDRHQWKADVGIVRAGLFLHLPPSDSALTVVGLAQGERNLVWKLTSVLPVPDGREREWVRMRSESASPRLVVGWLPKAGNSGRDRAKRGR